MSTQTAPSTCIVPPAAGRVLRAFGEEIIFHFGAAESGGRYTMFTAIVPPGGGPPPHYHMNEDEWFLVQEGRAEFLKDGSWIDAPVGTVVYTPRGVVHTFRNPGDTPLRMLVHAAPCGFETFYARCAAEFAKPGPPDMDVLVQIAGEHGIHFVRD
jgi:mannose-6-phosphate isomerase-like protein (cupin superfamily)